MKPAIHGHDFETSGHVKDFVDGQHETCRFCGWPFDEHPNLMNALTRCAMALAVYEEGA